MISTLTSLVGGIELLAELTAAGVALMALDRLAAAIRFTYKAGRYVGHLWFTYGVPAVLATADFISWVNSQIDWHEVRSGVIEGLRIFIALTITVCIQSYHLLLAVSERLGHWYSALIIGTDKKSSRVPYTQPRKLDLGTEMRACLTLFRPQSSVASL
jgi:hypothetical protein